MKNIKRLLTITLTILIFQNFVSAIETDPKIVVEKFYKFHRTRNGALSTHELNLLKGWLTNDLVKLFRNEIKREEVFTRKNPNDKPYFGDGLPFLPYEECVVGDKIILNRLETGKAKVELNKAIVEVKFFIPKECEGQAENNLIDIYEIELQKNKTRWLINDWIYSDGKRLTEVLKREKY